MAYSPSRKGNSFQVKHLQYYRGHILYVPNTVYFFSTFYTIRFYYAENKRTTCTINRFKNSRSSTYEHIQRIWKYVGICSYIVNTAYTQIKLRHRMVSVAICANVYYAHIEVTSATKLASIKSDINKRNLPTQMWRVAVQMHSAEEEKIESVGENRKRRKTAHKT